MKKLIALFFIGLLGFGTANVQAQTLSSRGSLTYFALDKQARQKQILDFVSAQHITILKLDDNTKQFELQLIMNQEQYAAFKTASMDWGRPGNQHVMAEDRGDKLTELDNEIKFTAQKLEHYNRLLQELKPEDNNYLEFWREARDIEAQQQTLQKRRRILAQSQQSFEVEIFVIQEKNPMDDHEYSLVNMPGIEYAYLHIETPKVGVSAKEYHGLFLKYMFTRGKSYGLIGAFKDLSKSATESQTDEMFLFAIGQDFYSRYFGGGNRKSLNLYSSFNLGYLLATSELEKWDTGYLSAFIGLELLKTKYVILDQKAGYFVPFTNNRNMRGFSYRVSFNFMF